MAEEKLLNIKQAAQLLNVSEISLRRWTDSGRLACLRVGARRERRFREADLLAFLERPVAGGGHPAGTSVDPERHLFIEGLTVERGSHLCALYETDLGRVKLSVPFLADGLRAGELCLLVADDEVSAAILAELRVVLGVAVEEALAEGRLILSGGEPTGERLFAFLQSRFVEATRAGRPGIRVVGDMSASLSKGMALDDLLRFEARYDQSLADQFPVVSLCQYDARQFPGVGILKALKCHRDTFRYPLARFLN